MTLKRFKDTFPTYAEFEALVIQPCKDNLGDLEWLNDQSKYYKVKSLYFVLKNAYSERIQYHTGDEFLGYFNNIFLQVAPTYFARVQQLIADKISELQDTAKAGKGSSLTSESNRAQSTTPFGNYVDQLDNVDAQQQSLYKLNNANENLIEIAARLSAIRINGEVQKFVASFGQLFTKTSITQPVKYDFFQDVVNTVGEFDRVLLDLAAKYDTLYKYYHDHNGNLPALGGIKFYDTEAKFSTESHPGEFGWTNGGVNGKPVVMLNNAGTIEYLYTVADNDKRYLTEAKGDARYERKQAYIKISMFTNNNSGGQAYLIGNKPAGFDDLPIGKEIELDLSAIKDLSAEPIDKARLYIGQDHMVMVAPNNSLEYNFATNPGEPMVKPNYATKLLVGTIVDDGHNGKGVLFKEWKENPYAGATDVYDYMDDATVVDLEGVPILSK